MIREILVKAVGSLLGAKFTRSRFPHSFIAPRDSTYSPWRADADFQRVYEQIKAYTMVEVYRCYELWTLALQVRHLNGSYIEVGCWRGGTGCLIAAAAGKPIVLCDTFSGVVKTSRADNTYVGGEHSDASQTAVRELARSIGVEADVLAGVFPEDTGKAVAEMRFAMCHIDVDVYRSAKDAAEWLWPRVLPGGIVVFDDYGCATCDGIREYVHELGQRSDRIIVHNLNGHAVAIKLR